MTAQLARKEADAAWEAYRSTCTLGGTPDERAWAFAQAINAEDRAHRLEQAAKPATKAAA